MSSQFHKISRNKQLTTWARTYGWGSALYNICKKANKEFTIVPIIVGDINAEEAEAIAKDINRNWREHNHGVSSDLSHYKSQEKAKETDNKTMRHLGHK